MYLRFVISQRDRRSHSLQGIFQAAFELRDRGALESHEQAWLDEALDWMNENLPAPPCLEDEGSERAICWFRHQAQEAIVHARSMAALLKENGHVVRMLTAGNPGAIVYEDDCQVAAKPWRNARRARATRLSTHVF